MGLFDKKDEKKVSQDVQQVPVELVKMVRDEVPFTADVHPDEVENFSKAGWKIKEKE